ncbi:hypothetical protein CPC16_006922 [Podila verticillata]|nr:hypothetical protein CPC16_006922 [Podila verticillata]
MGWAPMEPDYATCGMTTWVGSFDPLMFIYFMLATVLIPYPTYIVVSTIFNWEHRKKRPARHYQDLMQAASYGVIVFIFGNYAQTLNWITILAFWITWPSYSLIAELDFAKTSLPSWKTWPFGMYALFAGATALVLIFAAYHIYLGYLLTKTVPGFVGYYLLGLLIPFILTFLGYAAYKQQNLDALGLSKVYNWILSLQYKQSVASARRKANKQKKLEAAKAKQIDAAAASASASGASHGPDAGTVPSSGSQEHSSSTAFLPPNSVATSVHVVSRSGSHEHLIMNPTTTTTSSTLDPNVFARPSTPHSLPPNATLVVIDTQPASPVTELQVVQEENTEVTIQPYQPYVWSVDVQAHFHPHHWQLFYMLAFFTRFDHWVSRVGGGIVLGCYMQGIMAYGYDYLIEE